jgi:hypothetical protein
VASGSRPSHAKLLHYALKWLFWCIELQQSAVARTKPMWYVSRPCLGLHNTAIIWAAAAAGHDKTSNANLHFMRESDFLVRWIFSKAQWRAQNPCDMFWHPAWDSTTQPSFGQPLRGDVTKQATQIFTSDVRCTQIHKLTRQTNTTKQHKTNTQTQTHKL